MLHWLCSPFRKEKMLYLPLSFIRVDYSFPPSLGKKCAATCGYFLVWKSCSTCPRHPSLVEHQSTATVQTSSPFWHRHATSGSSNYSSYKKSTLLLVKPRYNNTTKHFKETTQISGEIWKLMDYALGPSQASNAAGARFLFSRAGPNLDNHEVGRFKTEILHD